MALLTRSFDLTRTVEGSERERRKVGHGRLRFEEFQTVEVHRAERLNGLEQLSLARTGLPEEVAKKESSGKIGVG